MKKIYTCTPVAFHANDGFHIRDTGLIAAGLRNLGYESKCIMPLPAHAEDLDLPLIRTEYKNLSSVAWWRGLKIDGVILYSWAAPRYLRIARAIRKAGIPLAIHLDTSGDFATKPFKFNKEGIKKQLVVLLQSLHLSYADVITASAPCAQVLSHHRFFKKSTANKFVNMSNPIRPACAYNGYIKENKIIAIGRWNDLKQKRPDFLTKTLQELYSNGCDSITEVYGFITESIREWHKNLPYEISSKILLKGAVPNQHLIEYVYNSAQIILCTSAFEGSHIVSCEALCCGCSVVTTNIPDALRNVIWYTTKESGTVSKEDTPESLAQAILEEVQHWKDGKRNPHKIAQAWQPCFHTDKVLPEIIRRFEQVKK